MYWAGVLAVGMGPMAQTMLEQNGIVVCSGVPSLPAKQLILEYLAGTLQLGDNACNHEPGAHGC